MKEKLRSECEGWVDSRSLILRRKIGELVKTYSRGALECTFSAYPSPGVMILDIVFFDDLDISNSAWCTFRFIEGNQTCYMMDEYGQVKAKTISEMMDFLAVIANGIYC